MDVTDLPAREEDCEAGWGWLERRLPVLADSVPTATRALLVFVEAALEVHPHARAFPELQEAGFAARAWLDCPCPDHAQSLQAVSLPRPTGNLKGAVHLLARAPDLVQDRCATWLREGVKLAYSAGAPASCLARVRRELTAHGQPPQ